MECSSGREKLKIKLNNNQSKMSLFLGRNTEDQGFAVHSGEKAFILNSEKENMLIDTKTCGKEPKFICNK